MKDIFFTIILLAIAAFLLYLGEDSECPECGGNMVFDGYKRDECEECGYYDKS